MGRTPHRIATAVVFSVLTLASGAAWAKRAFHVRDARAFTMKLKYKGEMHEALVHVPKNRPGQKLRVILNYHGYGCDGPQHAKYTGMAELGTREGFIVVHPTGTKGPIGMRTWDGINNRLVNMFEKNDDVGFTRALLGKLEKQIHNKTGLDVSVDKKVVFASGFSNGAFLTHLLARRLPEIKAIAPVSGQLAAKGRPHRQQPILPPPDHKVAMLELHGTKDPLVLYRGRQGGLAQGGVQDLSALRTAQIMAKNNGHRRRADRIDHPTASTIVRTWGKDPKGMVKLVSLRGGGHSVPGTDPNKVAEQPMPSMISNLMNEKLFKTVTDFNGPQEIVNFFKDVSAAYPVR